MKIEERGSSRVGRCEGVLDSFACPVCGGKLVASGEVDGLGLVWVCADPECPSQGSAFDCRACGGPRRFAVTEAEGEAPPRIALHCVDPFCPDRS